MRAIWRCKKNAANWVLAMAPERATYSVRPEPGADKSNRILVMSQHRSLRAAATLGGKRNVLKRFERVEILKKRGQWKDGDRITGLRKTKPEV